MPPTDPNSQALMNLPDDEILALLGADLVGPQALPLRTAELTERGRRWFAAQRDYLEGEICSNEAIKRFVSETTDNSAIAEELAKLLFDLVLPVNPVPLAVLVARRGIKTFCSTRWSQNV